MVYVKRTDGHRKSYQGLFSRLFGLDPLEGSLNSRKFRQLIAAPRLIFTTIDDDYFGFFFVAVVRALTRRRTVAIFLRPGQCFETGRFYYPLKRVVFKLLKYLPGLSVLTIIPFDIRPEFSEVANGWIHDPQLWDMQLDFGAREPDARLGREIRSLAAGRKVLSFIGVGSEIKGLSFLAEIIRSQPAIRDSILVVVAGKVENSCAEYARDLEEAGMLVVDRIVSNEEIMSCYDRADLVWCCYRPDYDQASGIFGRAVQTGRRPIVREGSVVHAYSLYFNVSPVAIEFGDAENAAGRITSVIAGSQTSIEPPTSVLHGIREDSQLRISNRL